MYLGVDDTDSPDGMCTTFLATELVREFSDLDLLGYPRLVRLNPNVSWKTRGNGAIALRLGKGRGDRCRIGELAGTAVHAFSTGVDTPPTENLLQRAEDVLDRWAVRGAPDTNPGLVLLPQKPPQQLYWRAVRGLVRKEEISAVLMNGLHAARGNGRGLIGACAAVAWRPQDRTYEVIAYRQQRLWGTERKIDPESVAALDARFPSTFNNYDPVHRKIVIAPGSPCPILFGIRGEDPRVLPDAMRSVRSEPADRWLVYLTNHGTDDHLTSTHLLEPYTSVRASALVDSHPRTIQGGHVLLDIRIGKERITAAAYEPSKEMRRVVRRLVPGDRLTVCGNVRAHPRTLNLEKFRIVHLAEVRAKFENPLCPGCGRHMKSRGRDVGYRCPRCRTRASSATTMPLDRGIRVGWYEPPVCARRHITKPLRRMERS
ncbi:MAG: tRNA(Ile)(2)-agmatinylcytidine synthase [Candidatus Thermoplasmatota archaeon]